MKWGCQSRRTFFVQPVVPAEELLNYKFYLLNSGNGYTDLGVDQMTVEEMKWHVRKLGEKIVAENEAREALAKAMSRRH